MKIKIVLFITSFMLLSPAAFPQDILISFAGTGDATTVETVTVVNITQNKKRTLSGSDILRLTATTTGIDDILPDRKGEVEFFPNPAEISTKLRFSIPVAGRTEISVTDMSGRRLATYSESLPAGNHLARIEGMPRGMSFVTVRNGSYSRTGRLIGGGQSEGNVKISYENQIVAENEKKDPDSKGEAAEVWMQYSPNDRLEITGTSGQCAGFFSDIPKTSKTITFDFRRCVDPDGNKYKVVKIGPQYWMAENLRTTKYNDGTSIRYVDNNPTEWAGIRDEGAYSFYKGDTSRYKQYYGGYYNFYAVQNGGVCPTGWHVPSIDEYTQMINWLITNGFNFNNSTNIYDNYVAKALASGGNIYLYGVTAGPSITWIQTDDDGTPGCADYPSKVNASGFSAIPAGLLNGQGFTSFGSHGNFWTSSQWDMQNGRFMHIQYNMESFSMSWTAKWIGYNVRCLKN